MLFRSRSSRPVWSSRPALRVGSWLRRKPRPEDERGAETGECDEERRRPRVTEVVEHEAHPKVARVHYPGLASHPQHALASELFAKPGALLSFELKNATDTFPVLNKLELGILSSNLGDARTLLIPVAQTIFWELGSDKRREMGIAESLVRVSVGIEDTDDLLADFMQALV